MKKQFLEICKRHGVDIFQYHTCRSDFGCQVYNLNLLFKDKHKAYSDSYYPSEAGAKERMLNHFEKEILEFISLTPKH